MKESPLSQSLRLPDIATAGKTWGALPVRAFGFSLREMSDKEIVQDILQRLPAGASLREIARQIESAASVRHPSGVSRLAAECAKLFPTEEQAWAELGMDADVREWPAY